MVVLLAYSASMYSKPCGSTNSRAMRRSGDRILDGLDLHLDDSGDREAADPLLLVCLEFDRAEKRFVELLGHRRRDAEDRRKRFRFLPRQDLQDRVALARVGALIDDGKGFSVSLMNCPRPRQNCRCLQPIEFHVAEMSLVDAECDDCPAIAARGQGVELARAPPIAIAARDLGTFDTPIDVRHRNPPGVPTIVILAVPLRMRIREPTICDRKRGPSALMALAIYNPK